MSNLPILYQNILDGLPSDFAKDVFLWAVGRFDNDHMAYKAEAFARETVKLKNDLSVLLTKAAWSRGEDSFDEGLMRFFLKRHANYRLGGNVNPEYAETP